MRRILIVVLVLLVLLAAPLVGIALYLDAAVSRAATYALGVETSANLLLRPISGQLSVFSLRVANPPGFRSPHFLELSSGRFELSLASLRQDTVESPLLRLEGVGIALERDKGRTNYGTILENLARFEGEGAESEAAEEAGGSGKQFVIRRLEIRDVEARVELLDAPGDAAEVAVRVPEIVLTDVGAGGGVDLQQLTDLVVKAILTAVYRQGDLPGALQAALRSGLSPLDSVSFEMVGAESARDAAEEAQRRANELAPGLGDAAGDALRGLLDKKK